MKLDLKKTEPAHYGGKAGEWVQITIPPMHYLAVDGEGAPGSAAYADAMAKLYPVAYGVKFAAKQQGRDFVVPPQSSLWWADTPDAFVADRRDKWKWRAMIRMPDMVTVAEVDASMAAKGITGVALVSMDEGLCFQCLHIGPYAEEAPVLAKLHDVIMPRAGMGFNGHHHEIYLSDPRRVEPARLRTVLRQPVRAL